MSSMSVLKKDFKSETEIILHKPVYYNFDNREMLSLYTQTPLSHDNIAKDLTNDKCFNNIFDYIPGFHGFSVNPILCVNPMHIPYVHPITQNKYYVTIIHCIIPVGTVITIGVTLEAFFLYNDSPVIPAICSQHLIILELKEKEE